MTSTELPDLMKFDEVCSKLGLSRTTIENLVREKKLRAVKLGEGPKAPVRFRPEDVAAYIESRLTFSEAPEAAPTAPEKPRKTRRVVTSRPLPRRSGTGRSLMERLA